MEQKNLSARWPTRPRAVHRVTTSRVLGRDHAPWSRTFDTPSISIHPVVDGRVVEPSHVSPCGNLYAERRPSSAGW
jgi:hypothetical protein